MNQDLSGKSRSCPEHGQACPHDGKVERPLSKEEYAGLAAGDPFNETGLIAAGKKLCGMCDFKTGMKKKWKCLHSPRFTCPVPDPQAGCLGYRQSARSCRRPIAQPKKKGLPVPEGVKFFYFGRPAAHSGPYLGRSPHDHQGVVTVAWIEPSPGLLHLAFSFCSPEDRWCKATGRDMALARLLRPAVIPFLYSPARTVREVVRAVLTHDFMRIYALSPGATMLGSVPSWTKNLARRLMGGTEREQRGRGKTLGDKLAWLRAHEVNLSTSPLKNAFAPPLTGFPFSSASLDKIFRPPLEVESPLGILAPMMADIAKLDGR